MAFSEESGNTPSSTTKSEIKLSSHYFTGENISLIGIKKSALTIAIGKAIKSRNQLDSTLKSKKFNIKYKIPTQNNLVINAESDSFKNALKNTGVYPIEVLSKNKSLLKTFISVSPKDFETNLQTVFLTSGEAAFLDEITNSNVVKQIRHPYSSKASEVAGLTKFDDVATLGDLTYVNEIYKYLTVHPTINYFGTCPNVFDSTIALVDAKNLSSYSAEFSSQKIQKINLSTVFPVDKAVSDHLEEDLTYENKASYLTGALTIGSLEEPSKTKTINIVKNVKSEKDVAFINDYFKEITNSAPLLTNFISGAKLSPYLSPNNTDLTKSKCSQKRAEKLISSPDFKKKIYAANKTSKDISVPKDILIQSELNSLITKEPTSLEFIDEVYSKLNLVLPKALRSTGASSQLPATITNESKYKVSVVLSFIGTNTTSKPGQIELELKPKETRSVEFVVNSKSGGTHKVEIELGTPNNLYTRDYTTTIRSQGIKVSGLIAMSIFIFILLLWWILYSKKHKKRET
jgi:hypothetical protein